MDHAIRPAKEFGMRIDGEPIKQRLQFGPKAAALSGVALELEIAILQSRWAVSTWLREKDCRSIHRRKGISGSWPTCLAFYEKKEAAN